MKSTDDRVAKLEETIKKMDLEAEVALCSFTFEAAREHHKRIRFLAKKAGLQGGITVYNDEH